MGADQGLTRRRNPAPEPAPIRVFYDADCGLCQGAVRFAVRRDRAGRLRFAPRGGTTFIQAIPPEVRAALPDSLIALAPDGGLRTRSGAVVQILRSLGGVWPLLGWVLASVPGVWRDRAYDWVARRRSRTRVCPVDPAAGNDRFDP